MSASAGFELRVGGRVWLDGQGWEVAELTGTRVRLIAEGRLRTVSVTSLIGNDQVGDDVPVSRPQDLWTVPAVVLAGLSTRQRDVLTHKLHVLRALVEPEHGDDRSVREQYEATAYELGVTRRTLERQLAKLKQHGPAGLVDVRKLREVRRSVHPRWDSICREVLASHTNRSNPTMQSVIDQTNRPFVQECPDATLPSRAGAYRRLEELDKGRYTFGAAKQRRSVANRPTGVLGRLRADRPGQYVLLGSYRMDVFAMEPVTCAG